MVGRRALARVSGGPDVRDVLEPRAARATEVANGVFSAAAAARVMREARRRPSHVQVR